MNFPRFDPDRRPASPVAVLATKPKPQPPVDTPAATTTTTTQDHTGKYTVDSLDTDSCLRQRVLYFDLNETTIRPEFHAAVACHAAYLHQFPHARVTLEGNADERGTREYNLGLGERRGNAVIKRRRRRRCVVEPAQCRQLWRRASRVQGSQRRLLAEEPPR